MIALWIIIVVCTRAATCTLDGPGTLVYAYIHDPGRDIQSIGDCRAIARGIIEPGVLTNCEHEELPT